MISRRFHKFFNIGELPECEDDKVRLHEKPYHILEKMDGSLVAPLLTDGKVKLGSKMGVTEMSNKMEDDFLASSKVDYIPFCEEWMSKDYTPVRRSFWLCYQNFACALLTLCRCLSSAHVALRSSSSILTIRSY